MCFKPSAVVLKARASVLINVFALQRPVKNSLCV